VSGAARLEVADQLIELVIDEPVETGPGIMHRLVATGGASASVECHHGPG
jgi:hypothetical protein